MLQLLFRRLFAVVPLAALAVPSHAFAIKVYENEEAGTQLSVGGYFQPYLRWVDDACVPSAEQPDSCVGQRTNDGFGLDRARLNVSGNTNGIADFSLEIDGLPSARVLEANATFEPVESLRLQIGLFKVPFLRGELVSDSRRQFITRAETIRVAPARQIGVTAEYGLPASLTGLPEDLVVLTAGIFNGEKTADLTSTANVDERFLTVVRLEVHPFGRPARLAEGDVRSLDDRSEPSLSIGGNFAHNRSEPDDYTQDAIAADLFFAWHGLSLYGDYVRSQRNFGSEESGLDQIASGFNAQLGYFIPATYIEEHLELVARVEQFDPRTAVDDANEDALLPAAPRGGPAVGSSAEQEQLGIHGGFNWYFAGHDLKLQAQYVHRVATEQWSLSSADSSVAKEFDDDTFYTQLTYRF